MDRTYNEVHAAAEELQLAYDYVKEGIVSEEEVDEAYGNAIQLVESWSFAICCARKPTR